MLEYLEDVWVLKYLKDVWVLVYLGGCVSVGVSGGCVGVGVSGGCEAAVHAIRWLVDDHVFVKFDVSNAFNTVRIDTILNSTANKTPERYRFVHASLACSPTLTYGTEIHQIKGGIEAR